MTIGPSHSDSSESTQITRSSLGMNPPLHIGLSVAAYYSFMVPGCYSRLLWQHMILPEGPLEGIRFGSAKRAPLREVSHFYLAGPSGHV
jgi:hypothetical protein